MLPKNRIPTHPGIILRQEFLAPLRVTQVDFAAHIGVPLQRVNEIVRGERDTRGLASAADSYPESWMRISRTSYGWRARRGGRLLE